MNIYCFSTLSFAKLQFKSVINKAFHKHGVASFTDAWIETIAASLRISGLLTVASFTDAWIETICAGRKLQSDTSHLLQMRGLKHRYAPLLDSLYVASFTDAWIETGQYKIYCPYATSHLLQMRGLKPESKK